MNAAPTQNTHRRAVVPTLVIVVAVVLIVFVVFLQRGTAPSAETPASPANTAPATAETVAPPAGEETAQPDLTAIERRDENDPLTAGSPDAPVGMVVFSDYQCGYCAKWSAETLPTMLEYAERGDLWIEWRDLNIFDEPSRRAARASYAAGLQDAFWPYHDQLYPEGKTRSADQLTDEALIALAGELELDTERFAVDMNAEDTVAAVAANEELGRRLGASSTPAFLLGGTPIVGAQPTEVFVEVIETALADQA